MFDTMLCHIIRTHKRMLFFLEFNPFRTTKFIDALHSRNYEQKRHDETENHSAFAEIAATVETGSGSLSV